MSYCRMHPNAHFCLFVRLAHTINNLLNHCFWAISLKLLEILRMSVSLTQQPMLCMTDSIFAMTTIQHNDHKITSM